MEFKCHVTQKMITASKKISREVIFLAIPFQMSDILTLKMCNN